MHVCVYACLYICVSAYLLPICLSVAYLPISSVLPLIYRASVYLPVYATIQIILLSIHHHPSILYHLSTIHLSSITSIIYLYHLTIYLSLTPLPPNYHLSLLSTCHLSIYHPSII
jgi:hypothetical protein